MWMRCEVDVVFRPPDGCNIRKMSRPCRAMICIGKEGGRSNMNCRISMLILTNKSRKTTKYLLSGNIKQIYTRFVDEGKGTVSQLNPPQDICISKADPVHLKTMLSVLRMMANGSDIGKFVTHRSDQAPTVDEMRMPRRTMVVTTRREYPLIAPFPGTLERLTVTGCAMKRIDSRIVNLGLLELLNLSNNMLSTLPDNLSRWTNLSELDLSSNRLSVVPSALYDSCVKDSLSVLKLNSNCLVQLPPQICRIAGLVQLHVNDNELAALPPTIGSMSKLFIISAQRNQITQLPSGITKLKLESLDLFGNPIQELEDSVLLSSNLGVPTLREVTARSIHRQGLAYTEEDLLPHLIFYLKNARLCWCGRYCFESCARYLRKCELSQLSSTVQAWNILGNTTVPLEAFLCSATCLQKFKSNPFAYWK